MARLEGSGVAFLRSLCKLTHVGHAQYYKGDGHAFQDYLENHYPGHNLPQPYPHPQPNPDPRLNQNPTLHPIPDLTNTCVVRAEHSKRQDWSLEAAYDIFPLVDPLLNYTGEAQGKGLLGGGETYRIPFHPLPSH
jgi:hypothetical protein